MANSNFWLKVSSLRVNPECTPHLIEYICTFTISATWHKDNHDTFTIFSGSQEAINVIHAFTIGYSKGRESGGAAIKTKLGPCRHFPSCPGGYCENENKP